MPSYGVLVPGNPMLVGAQLANRETTHQAVSPHPEVAQALTLSVCGWVSLMVCWTQPEEHWVLAPTHDEPRGALARRIGSRGAAECFDPRRRAGGGTPDPEPKVPGPPEVLAFPWVCAVEHWESGAKKAQIANLVAIANLSEIAN